jgi:hypothetical protein
MSHLGTWTNQNTASSSLLGNWTNQRTVSTNLYQSENRDLDETVHISFRSSDLGSSVIVPKYTVQHHQTPSLSFNPASYHRALSAHECHAPPPHPPPTSPAGPVGSKGCVTSPPSPPWKSKKENFYPLPPPPICKNRPPRLNRKKRPGASSCLKTGGWGRLRGLGEGSGQPFS